MPIRSVFAPVLYDLSHRSRMGKISATQVPTGLRGGGGQRFMHPSDRRAGGGEPSSQAFRASRILVKMPCFVF
jgi:hypothetical protein